ncbi:MAG: hypothetical protein H0X47_18585 [Nitrospirales bacterium]|nr:hypothetical protein [Nitrospirales bacterium]
MGVVLLVQVFILSSFLKLVFALSRGAESKTNPKEKGGRRETDIERAAGTGLHRITRDSRALAMARAVRGRRFEKAR